VQALYEQFGSMPARTMATSPAAGTNKNKKTKLEKIFELESSLRISKEGNRALKKELHYFKGKAGIPVDEDGSVGSEFTDPSVASTVGGGDNKLKEALRALKRVTVQQELSLKTLRVKAQQRRKEIEQKDEIFENLREEVESLKKAHNKLRGNGSDNVGALQARLADLELELAKEDTRKEDQTKKLTESRKDITSLRGQLEQIKGRPQRAPSSRSLKSADTSLSSADDVSRLKRELAKKMEKIANLEYDLESARDEIHELKQKKEFGFSFPATPAPGTEDFFSDNEEEEDDFWGS
jgi:hypothetical protein